MPARLTRRTAALAAAALLASASLAACTDDSGSAPPTGPDAEVSGEVTVLAASSLTDVFAEVGREFEDEYPDAEVQFSFAGSATLVQQVVEGAPADVLATADPVTMQEVVDDGRAEEPFVFARNRLVIAVPEGNPANVDDLADLGDPGLRVALCAEQVPCGRAAQEAFDAAGVEPAPDTLEQDVKATLSKVELGEADAALVYQTDVRASGDEVEGIAFPEAGKAVNDYPVVTLSSAPNPAAARAFVDVLRSPEGQAALLRAGFERP